MDIKVTAPVRIDISAGWSDADPFRHEFGGAILNGAINLRVFGQLKGKELITSLDKVPANSGLGTSGALRTVYLVASNPSLIDNKMDLLKRVNILENSIIGQRAGFQDQAAAIYGGVNFWEFGRKGQIRRIEIPKKSVKHLHDRLVLVFTGSRHESASVHEDVFTPSNFMKKVTMINKMKLIAKKMSQNIENEHMIGKLISETWELQKQLHRGIETDNMRKIVEVADGLYLGARATGAGGGGCMIFYTRDGRERKSLIGKFKRGLKGIKGANVIPFDFDYSGIRIEKS